jgi:hypothetical protein
MNEVYFTLYNSLVIREQSIILRLIFLDKRYGETSIDNIGNVKIIDLNLSSQ